MGKKHGYGVIVDAGSSGSRVYVYEYQKAEYVKGEDDKEKLERLPKVKTKKKWSTKIYTGMSTFAEKPDRVGPDHLKELVEFAQEIVPESEVENTPIFVLATAGMRLLQPAQSSTILRYVCAYFKEYTKFQLPDCGGHVQMISGETEGLYGWIAANYLLGGFDDPKAHDHGKNHHTYGFLDMGGASAQIAFAPNATESEKHADDLKLLRLRKVNGESLEYGVFVTTWLGFGANEARRRYVELREQIYRGESEIPDPCMLEGLRTNQAGAVINDDRPNDNDQEPTLVGTGEFSKCLDGTYPLLEKGKACVDPPCLLNGVHTPSIDFDVNHFVGVSNYWHTTHEIFGMAHKDQAYDFLTYQKQVQAFCARDWQDVRVDVGKETWGSKVDEQKAAEVCFRASWLINMLHEGIGVPRVGKEHINHAEVTNTTKAVLENAKSRGFLDPFQAVDKIDGTELSWTLGKMVLYASSQMPAANGAMAVGFGSNSPGAELPGDFQHPSGKIEGVNTAPAHAPPAHKGQDLHRSSLKSTYSRRVPGILIFLVIIVLVFCILCGRERRTAIWHKAQTLSGRRRSPNQPYKRRAANTASGFSSRMFGKQGQTYERVLEEGTDPSDFELSDVSEERYSESSSSGGDVRRAARSSGWTTPTASSNRGLSPDVSRNSPKGKAFVELSSANNVLGITPFEREGLIVRTDSRERLTAASHTHTRSRTGSPRRSPLTRPLSPRKKSAD